MYLNFNLVVSMKIVGDDFASLLLMCTVSYNMVKTLFVFLFVCVSLQTVFCQSGTACETSDGEVGSCIAFQSCEYYLKLLKELGVTRATDILRKAQCGFEGQQALVCCPTAASAVGDYVPAFLDPPVCGLSNASYGKVVGGENAKLNDYPWMALLGYKTRIGSSWMCGGSLISVRHVLTAAHCIHNREDKLYVVRLGELDLAREDEGAYPIDFLIKKMIAHEQYDANVQENDIGVLILQKDVEFTNSIRPICMPKTSELRAESFEDYNPLIAGWGRTSYNGEAATHLQVLQLPVLNNNVCVEAYKEYKGRVFDQRVICAGYKNGGKDSCQGDSGGPLMQPLWSDADKKAYFFEIGIVSYGRGCAQAEFPGVYTRITNFLPWIEEKVLGRTTG